MSDALKRKKKPWPTKDAMQQVYSMQLWGSNGADFYSGEGSHQKALVEPYVYKVVDFLMEHPSFTVLDVGCGDFNVGSQICDYASKYTAVDIVPELIERNKLQFKSENLHFACLDLAKDTLPAADVLIIRQVLQHLSNKEIGDFLPQLKHYKFVILTEHLPNGDFVPNKDIISGQGIRLKKKSGLDLLADPFNWHPKHAEEWLSIDLGEKKGRVVTTLYTI